MSSCYMTFIFGYADSKKWLRLHGLMQIPVNLYWSFRGVLRGLKFFT